MRKLDVLRGDKTFSRVYNKGKSIGGRYVVIFFKPNGLSYNRFGFLASKKVGKAVARNRARRLMKEAVRLEFRSKLRTGQDYIFVARNTIIKAKMQDVGRSLFGALKKSELI